MAGMLWCFVISSLNYVQMEKVEEEREEGRLDYSKS